MTHDSGGGAGAMLLPPPPSPKREGPLWEYADWEADILQERRAAGTSFLGSLSTSAAAVGSESTQGTPLATESATALLGTLVTGAPQAGLLVGESDQQLLLKQMRSLESLDGVAPPHLPSSYRTSKSGVSSLNVSNIQVISGRTMNLLRKSNSGLLSMVDELGHSRIQFATEEGAFISSTISVIPYLNPVKKAKVAQAERMTARVDLLALQASLATAVPYNPNFLDDPDLKIGRHKTIITLPCFMGSIIQYSKPADIKKELNEHFREAHSNLDPSLTLSQIRNMKEHLINIGMSQDLELSSVAMSFVYFEKLVLKNFVGKANRKLVGGICIFLACKVNDPKDINLGKLLQAMERELDVGREQFLDSEYSVYSALDFHLFVPHWELRPHLDRILRSRNLELAEYLEGDKSS